MLVYVPAVTHTPRAGLTQVFQEMWRSPGKTAEQIIQEKDLGLVTDTAQLHSICQRVVDSHPDEVRTVHPEMTSAVLFFCFKSLSFLKKKCLCLHRFMPLETEIRRF